jgi:hypothetical protein
VPVISLSIVLYIPLFFSSPQLIFSFPSIPVRNQLTTDTFHQFWLLLFFSSPHFHVKVPFRSDAMLDVNRDQSKLKGAFC